MDRDQMAEIVKETLESCKRSLDVFLTDSNKHLILADAAKTIADSLKAGGKVYSCGNGGSLCDAMHFAEELTGRFRNDRRALPAIAISDPSHMSCTGNDYGFDYVFSRFIEAHARPGDVLLAISTSGTSRNVCLAAETAHQLGVEVIGLTGHDHSKFAHHCKHLLVTPSDGQYADRVQELHIKCIHILIQLIESELELS